MIDAIRKAMGVCIPATLATSPIRAYMPAPIVVPSPYSTNRGKDKVRFKPGDVVMVVSVVHHTMAKGVVSI